MRTEEEGTGLEDELERAAREWIAVEWPFVAVRWPGRDLSWEEWSELPDAQ